MKILFLVPTDIQFGHDIWQCAPCPGAELAVVHTASALANVTGHDVRVVSASCRPATANGVRYQKDLSHLALGPSDILVHVRDYWRRDFQSPESVNVLWLHDTSSEIRTLASPGTDLRKSLMRWDALVFVSDWQRHEILHAAQIDPHDVVSAIMHHPLPPISVKCDRRQGRLIHTAHPRKALKVVLRSFELLARRRNDVELILCGHPTIYQQDYQFETGHASNLNAFVEAFVPNIVDRIAIRPNSLSQQEVIHELAQAEFLLHPDMSTETGATTVIEALSVGTVPIVSDLGCLPELCWGRGIVLEAMSNKLEETVADVANALLDDPVRAHQLAAACACFAKSQRDPMRVGEAWAHFLEEIRRETKHICPPASIPVRKEPNSPKRPNSQRWTISTLNAIDVSLVESFLGAHPDTWITHTKGWHNHIEQRLQTDRESWVVVLDTKAVVAIVPIARCPDSRKLVSGLVEPSGPLISNDLNYNDYMSLNKLIYNFFIELIETNHTIDSILIKYSAIGKSGLSSQAHRCMPFLFDGLTTIDDFHSQPSNSMQRSSASSARVAARFHCNQAFIFDRTWGARQSISSRLRTQLNHARRITNVQRAESSEDKRLAYNLYLEHCNQKGGMELDIDSLDEAITGCGGSLVTHLIWIKDGAIGFSYSLIWHAGAAVIAWGVQRHALATGAAKQLMVDLIDDLLGDAEIVEVGSLIQGNTELAGLAEFYRRLGGNRTLFLGTILERSMTDVSIRYPVL